ncbi:MAG: hypothetical protein PHO37_15920 [Kiritimatiellae bacterium]|nr:hypothetical protein [Kiritimatiellia bacterium]
MNPLFPIEQIAVYGVATAALVVWLSLRASGSLATGGRIAAVALRLVVVALLVLAALNPGHWRPRRREPGAGWALLVDQSVSMQQRDAAEGVSRWQSAVALSQRALNASQESALVGRFTFGEKLRPYETLSAQSATDNLSDLVGAGRDLLLRARSGGSGIRGIIVLSDGRDPRNAELTQLTDPARAAGCAFFPVVLGGEVEQPDIAVEPLRRQVVVSLGQSAGLPLRIQHQGLGAIQPEVSLLSASNETLVQKRFDLSGDGVSVVNLNFIPQGAVGYSTCTLKISSFEREERLDNNESRVGVLTLEDKMKILLCEGEPSWDSKFLVQLLRKQPNMDVTTMYRVAEDRYFCVESGSEEQIESDKPIFPDTAAKLAHYDIVIMGKGAEYFLDEERINLLHEFISATGGTLLFFRGKPYRSAPAGIERLEAVRWGDATDGKYRFAPTAAGSEAGLFGEMLPDAGDEIWKGLPDLEDLTACKPLNAFSRVLGEAHSKADGRALSMPVIVSRRVGRGMLMNINAAGMWSWDFFPQEQMTGELYARIWNQLIQWCLVTSEFLPGQDYALRMMEERVVIGEEASVNLRCRTQETSSAAQSTVQIQLCRGAQVLETRRVNAGINPERVVFTPQEAGLYQIRIEGSPVTAVFEVCPPPGERDVLSADRERLVKLAQLTGGRLIAPEEIEKIVTELESQEADYDETQKWVGVWPQWWTLTAVALALAVLWLIRRRAGLL